MHFSFVVRALIYRHEKAMVALEYPAKALKRVESAILMQSLVRRFLARVLVRQASLPMRLSLPYHKQRNNVYGRCPGSAVVLGFELQYCLL